MKDILTALFLTSIGLKTLIDLGQSSINDVKNKNIELKFNEAHEFTLL